MDRGWDITTCDMPSDWVVCAGVAVDPLVTRILWAVLTASLVLLCVQFYLSYRAGRFGVTLWSKTLVPGALVILAMSITKLVDPHLLIIGQDIAASILVVIALFSYTFSTQNLSASFVSASLEIAKSPAKEHIQASLRPIRFIIAFMVLCFLLSCAMLFALLYPNYRLLALRVFHLSFLGVSFPGILLLAWQGRQLSKTISNSYPNTTPPAHLAEFTSRLDSQAKISYVVVFILLCVQIIFAVFAEFSAYFFLPCLWTLFTLMQLSLLRFFKFKPYKPPRTPSKQSEQRTLVRQTSTNHITKIHRDRDYSETKANVLPDRSANPLASAPVSQNVCAVVITQATENRESKAQENLASAKPTVDIDLAESQTASVTSLETEVLVPLRILTPSRDRTQRPRPSASNFGRYTPSSMAPLTFTFNIEEGKSISPRTRRRTLSEDGT